MDTLELARHFVSVIEGGDIDAVRACYADDARIWHNFDDVEQTVDENMKVLAWMMKNAASRRYEIRRLEAIEGGYLQQHVLHLETRAGESLEMPACLVVRVEDGKIRRLEEYLDPAPATKLQ